MEPIKDLAIVLKAVAYEDRHRIVTAITQHHGKISAMARNAVQSRRFGGTLEPFSASEWRFSKRPGAELFQVEGAEIRRPYEGIRTDFAKLSLASTFSEVLLRIAPDQEPCEELFKLHANALAAVEELSPEISLLNAYLVKILKWSGNQPQLESCLHCGTLVQALEPDHPVYCVVADAGWSCCSGKRSDEGFDQLFRQMTPASLRDLKSSLDQPIRLVVGNTVASQAEHQLLFKFLESLMIYHLPGFDRTPLKSARFLNLTAAEPRESTLPPQPSPGQ